MRQRAAVFLDLRTAALEYPVSRRKLWQLIRDGRLAAYRLDGKLIMYREDVHKLLTALPAGRRSRAAARQQDGRGIEGKA